MIGLAGFDRDEFWMKILSMYPAARENNYVLRLDEEQIKELKSMYIDLYIPVENLSHYDDAKIMRKLMTAIVSIYKMDKDPMSNTGDVVQLVNTVNYDGRYMYLRFAKFSPVRMRRFELDMSREQLAEKIGYGISTVRNCEDFSCDLSRQPEQLVYKLAKALKCEPESLLTLN